MAGWGNDRDGYVGLTISVLNLRAGTNLGLGTATEFGSGSGLWAIANTSVVPTSVGNANGILYASSGHLWFLGGDGTLTQVASA